MKYKLSLEKIKNFEAIFDKEPTLKEVQLFALQALSLLYDDVFEKEKIKHLEEISIVDYPLRYDVKSKKLKTEKDLKRVFMKKKPSLYIDLHHSKNRDKDRCYFPDLKIEITLRYETRDLEAALHKNLTAENRVLRKIAKRIHKEDPK